MVASSSFYWSIKTTQDKTLFIGMPSHCLLFHEDRKVFAE